MSRKANYVALGLVLSAAIGLLAALKLWEPSVSTQSRDSIQLSTALNSGDNDEGYARAFAPRLFSFPQDHGPHPQFRTEWWYFTGNLDDRNGRPFGYQLTFFRICMSSKPVTAVSPWQTNEFYTAHFALSDITGRTFHSHERFNRAAMGLAGAKEHTLHVWLDNWSVEPQRKNIFPLRLRATQDDVAIDLMLEQGKPPVLQGDQGLSQKSAEPGNASYYYSLTRMPTSGTIHIRDQRFAVHGSSWMDREWSTSALGDDQVGWDWYSLQLSDQREIMFYRLRKRDGSTDIYSAGTLVSPDGTVQRLGHQDVEIATLSHSKSPRSGALYPARTRLNLPKEELVLEVAPLLADQELDVSVRYWEGAIAVRGTAQGVPVNGRGYLELTGYAE